MTYQEIFIQIISEVSGKPKQELSELLNNIRKIHPGGKWDIEIPDSESKELLTKLRGEAPGILRWLAEGALEVSREAAKHGSKSTH